MRARATRQVSVTTTPTLLRNTAITPPAFSIYRYASGGGTVSIGKASNITATTAHPVTADQDFVDYDSSHTRYALASAGTIVVWVTEYTEDEA